MKHYPLTSEQSLIFMGWDTNNSTTQYNMAGYLLFDKVCIDRTRLEKAIEKLVTLRPYLYNRLIKVSEEEVPALKYFEDPTRLIRQYPEMNQDIKLHYMEMRDEELDAYIHSATPPFNPFSEPMIRFGLVQTPTRSVITITFFHLLVDGVTMKAVNSDLEILYKGDEIAPQKMGFYEVATQRYAAYDSTLYLSDKKFFEGKFKAFEGFTDFARPFDKDLPWGNSIFLEKNISWKSVDEWAALHNCSTADLLMAIHAKTLSAITGRRTVSFYTYNHGRSAKDLKNVIYGHFLCPMVLMIDIEQDDSLLTIISRARHEMFSGLRHRTYPVFHYFLSREMDYHGTEFLYNGPYMEFTNIYDDNVTYWHWFDLGLSLSHLTFAIYQRGINYALEADCSDTLYLTKQIDSFMALYCELLTKCISGD